MAAGWRAVLLHAALAILALSYTGLLVVGALAWVRTAGVRKGAPGSEGPGRRGWTDGTSRGGDRTGRVTYLPALAGAGVLGWAVLQGISGHGIGAFSAGLVGLFILGTGLARRVVALSLQEGALVVRYAAGLPFRLPWTGCVSAHPPVVPWGAWRLRREDGRTAALMPSDLIGRERVLTEVIRRGGLRFDGRAWRKEVRAAARSERPSTG